MVRKLIDAVAAGDNGPPLIDTRSEIAVARWLAKARRRHAVFCIGPPAIPALLVALKRKETARFAIACLADLGAVEPLIDLVREHPDDLAVAAAFALARMAPPARAAIPALEQMLDRKDDGWAAADAIVELGPAALPAIARHLGKRHNGRLIGQLNSLGGDSVSSLVPFLVRSLESGKGWQKRDAAWALEEMGTVAAPAKPALMRHALSGEVLGWSTTNTGNEIAVRVLLRIGVTDDEARALAQATTGRGEALSFALEARVARIDPWRVSLAVAQLGMSKATTQTHALMLLTEVGRPVPEVRRLLNDNSPHVRRRAVRFLARTHDTSFELALNDGDSDVRLEVARGLIEWTGATRRAARVLAGTLAKRPEESARLLRRCGRDIIEARRELLDALIAAKGRGETSPVSEVVLACRELGPLPRAIVERLRGRLGRGAVGTAMLLWRSGESPEALLPVLIEGVRYVRWRRMGMSSSRLRPSSVRVHAIRTLMEMGAVARSAVPVLFAARRDWDRAVRTAAREALVRLNAR